MSESKANVIDAPQFVQRGAEDTEPNPLTPTLLTPLDNPAIKAVFDANREYERAWLKGIVDDYAWSVIKQQGELELDGEIDFDVEARKAFHVFIETCHARKVQEKPHPELLKADGAEFERVKIFAHLAGWGLDK